MNALAAFLERAKARSLTAMDLANAVQLVRGGAGPAGVKLLYDTWLEHNPDDQLLYAVLFNYAVALTDFGDLATAKTLLDRAIAIKPDFMPPYINLGRIYERLGATEIAVKYWTEVTKHLASVNAMAVTQKVTALNQTARVLENRHQDEPAESMLRQSIELDREQTEAMQHYLALRQRQCKWPVIQPWEKQTREMQTAALSPLSVAVHTDDPMLQLAVAWRYNKLEVPVSIPDMVTGHWAAQIGRAHV